MVFVYQMDTYNDIFAGVPVSIEVVFLKLLNDSIAVLYYTVCQGADESKNSIRLYKVLG